MEMMVFLWSIPGPVVDNEGASLGIMRYCIVSDAADMALRFIIL